MDELRRACAVVATAAVLVSACGGTHRATRGASVSSSSSAPKPMAQLQARLFRSVRDTRTARTARLALSIGISGLVQGGANLSQAGTGVVDFTTEDADLVLTPSVPGVAATPSEERIIDSVLYTRTGAGEPWRRVDLRKELGGSVAGLSSQVDPAQGLAYLAAVSDDVHTAGKELVRGVETTHYRATLDMAKALHGRQLTPAIQARVAQLAPKLGDQRIPIEAWVDAGGRLRRIVLFYPLAPLLPAAQAAGVPSDAMIHIQEDLYDFGTPVHIVAPPAGTVTG